MTMDHLSTELLIEILAYSVQEWSQKLLLDSKRSDSAYQDLRRHQGVCASWRLIIGHQILSEVNKWKPRMFRQKVLYAVERGYAIFIELAYSSKNGSLLGKATSSNGLRVPLEHVALANVARYDRYAVVRVLIDKGLDLNAAYMKVKESFTRSDGHTTDGSPLYNSVAWGNPRTAQLILENGADVNARKSGCPITIRL